MPKNYHQIWYQKNKEYCIQWARDYRKRNKAKIAAKDKLRKQKNQEAILARNTLYRRSPQRHPVTLYNAILYRVKTVEGYSKRRISFTKDEFLAFVKNSNYLKLYKKWEKSNFDYKLSPSVDRIDNRKGYSLDNIQLITKSENSKKWIHSNRIE